MEVPVTSILRTSKDDAGNLPIRAFVQESIYRRESQIAQTEFAPQTDAIRNIEI
jgi:hypothetical protein